VLEGDGAQIQKADLGVVRGEPIRRRSGGAHGITMPEQMRREGRRREGEFRKEERPNILALCITGAGKPRGRIGQAMVGDSLSSNERQFENEKEKGGQDKPFVKARPRRKGKRKVSIRLRSGKLGPVR